MPYRKIPFTTDEYFHLINRGNLKCVIFKDDADRARFLFYLLYFQSQNNIPNISRYTKRFLRTGDFGFEKEEIKKIIDKRTVKLTAFALMPNHFHILAQSTIDNGISIYMQRILNGYTKYFNTKYKQSGHLFSGPFRAVHVKNNEQLLYTSAYIHLNPKELERDQSVQHPVLNTLQYRWSSFSDFIKENRWDKLLDPSIITEQIGSKDKGQGYQKWVEESGAKEAEKEDFEELD